MLVTYATADVLANYWSYTQAEDRVTERAMLEVSLGDKIRNEEPRSCPRSPT